MQNKRKYLIQLTWLRGIAATLVVVSHCLRLSEGQYQGINIQSNHSLLYFFDLGTFGVMLFFTLSGTTLYFSNGEISTRNEILQYCIKRTLRIWPAFFVSLIAYILFMPIFQSYYGELNGNWVERQFTAVWNFKDLISYIVLSFNITGPSGVFNNAYWSLPVEFQYYLLFPILVFSLKHLGPAGPIAIAVFLYTLQKFDITPYHSNHFFLLSYTFCMGIVLAVIFKRTTLRLGILLAAIVFLLSIFTCSVANLNIINFGTLPIISNPYGFNGVFAIIVVFSILFINYDFNSSNILISVFYWLGEISYSLYLYHNLILGVLILAIINFGGFLILRNPVILFLITMILSSTIAYYSYKFIEKPGINFAKKIISHN